MKRRVRTALQRESSAAQGDKGGEAEDGERTIEAQDDHLFLDVWSIKQGALRLQTLPAAVLLLAFLGLYLCIGAVLNYNAIDADQRDIVTNMRIMLPGRMMAHNKSREFCRPIDVGVNAGDESVQQALQSVVKSRERLSDPRLLSYTDVLHPMVMMRQRTAGDFMDFITWEYYTATLPEITFPPFRWDAQLHFNVTFKIKTDHVLQAAQLYNMMKVQARPKMTYNQLIDDNRKQVWRVFASLGTDVRAYEIERVPPGSGMGSKHSRDSDKFRVKHPSKVLIETRFEAMDVPATFVQTDVSAPDYNGEQPVIKEIEDENKTKKRCDKYFNELPECRDTVYVPRIHGLRVLEFAQIFEGKWSEARAVLSSPPTVQLAVEIRDLSQPRPYAPKFFDFGRPFFTGFALLISAVLILFLWMGLRFYVVNKHVRENEGKPPLFYQGMLRFRGW